MAVLAAWSWTSYQGKKSLDKYLFQHKNDIAIFGADNSKAGTNKGTHYSLKKFYSQHELSLHIFSEGSQWNISKVEDKYIEVLLTSIETELKWFHDSVGFAIYIILPRW